MGKIVKAVKKIINLTPGIKEASVCVYHKYSQLRYRKYVKKYPVDAHTVMFESYMGRKYSCSPRSMFEAMCEDSRYRDYKKVWAFTDPEKHRYLEKYHNTILVKYRSEDYYRYYASAGIWITNYLLDYGIEKRPGQIYVQTWHGTPLKKIGCDVPRLELSKKERERTCREYQREGQMIDFMPSPSPFYTEKVKSAFCLGSQARVLEFGYPRNDDLFRYTEEKCENIKKELGIPADKKVILYAPTWRQSQHTAGEGFTYSLGIDFDKMKTRLGDKAVILFRTHYFISNSFDFSKYGGFIKDVSSYDEINDLYLISDLLITDYSSVFFDYANLERPILFYMYDYEAYREEMKDFYFGIELLPGPVIKEERDISEDVDKLLEGFTVDNVYRRFNEIFNPHRKVCGGEMVREITSLSPDTP